jgi:hypothetical protein
MGVFFVLLVASHAVQRRVRGGLHLLDLLVATGTRRFGGRRLRRRRQNPEKPKERDAEQPVHFIT